MKPKEDVAQELAEAHYAVEVGLVSVQRVLAADGRENDPKEPVKLLEVNENTTADGILPIFFGPRPERGIPYPSVIVEVTPTEYQQILQGTLTLPNGWRLGKEFRRDPVQAVGK